MPTVIASVGFDEVRGLVGVGRRPAILLWTPLRARPLLRKATPMFDLLRKKRRKSHQVQNVHRRCRLAVERLEDRCLLSVDPILEWNAVMIQADVVDQTVHQQAGPVLSGRAFAIVSAAMYDALNSIEQIGTPYLTVAPNAAGASV